MSQTVGEELTPTTLPEWDAKRAFVNLGIEQISFKQIDGNCQGYARNRQIAINPVAHFHTRRYFTKPPT